MDTYEYILVFSVLHFVTSNVLINPGFEFSTLSTAWNGNGGSIELVTGNVYEGRHALKAFTRTNEYNGPSQNVHLKPGSQYKFRAHVKQLNDKAGTMFQVFRASITYQWSDKGKPSYEVIAKHPFAETSTGWFLLEGDVLTPTRSFTTVEVLIEGPEAGVDFAVDDVELEEVWKLESKEMIDKHRKNKIDFMITHEPKLNAGDITIEIDHKHHLFGFGANVHQSWITDKSYREYQDIFYYLFNWGTIDGFAWPSTSTANPDYGGWKTAAAELQKHGLKVRVQSPLRAHGGKFPSWLQHMDRATFNQTVVNRIKTITSLMAGHVDQWEVMENTLNSQFYEEKTGDPNYSEQIYKLMHEALPSVDLFIADDNVLVTGIDTSALEEIAVKLKAFSLSGIDATSHFSSKTLVPTLVKMRLDTLTAAGLPLWISGLDITEENEDMRADMLERVLRINFAHPAVEGVTLWNFWDHYNSPNTALVEDFNFQLNAAGKRYVDLVKHEWSTHVSKKLSDKSTFTVDCFHGDYDVTVFYKGNPIMRREMHLGKSDLIFELHITGNGDQITLPTTLNPLEYSTHNYHISDKGQHSIGRAESRASHPELRCHTRWSKVSAVGDDKETSVSCQGDEILTGCSSVKEDFTVSWTRDGEFLESSGHGAVQCTAVNGVQSHKGVFAVAQCCSASQLKCDYSTTAFSENRWDSLIETMCPQNYIAAGCSSYNWDITLHGAYPKVDSRGCLAENSGPNFGVQSSAACCSSPGLTCTTVRSAQSGPRQGEMANVTCDAIAGHVMTSCNFLAKDGKSAGAYITGSDKTSKCVAINGNTRQAGQQGVVAIAVCCNINQSAPIIG